MKYWESLVDQKIREAMEQGDFDDLEGKGKPIDTTENPYEDPELRTAHRMLRNAGFAPLWIEERKEIDSEFENARDHLARSWKVLQNALGSEHERGARARWDKALSLFRAQLSEINRRIVVWNLKLPTAGFRRRLIDIEKEISQIEHAAENTRESK
jgi:hypothetical protein